MKNNETTTAIEMPVPILEQMKKVVQELEARQFQSLVGLCYGILEAGITVVPQNFAPLKTMTLYVSTDLYEAVKELAKNDKLL